jgi:2-dehydro-3-deoxyphosphogluconate aldolase/(4S)-4-hydroxy-2-oxoglutarate aldolase
MDATELLQGYRVVPVVVIESVDVAPQLAAALVEAGLNVIEVTLRTDDALAAIEAIATQVPEMIVGAGSIRRAAQFEEVKQAGAKFAVSPGASAALLDAADTHGMPFVPGAATASEMISLYERGYCLQKFFPAELAGGHAYLKSVGAPLPELRFMPTGGITPANAKLYLDLNNVQCIGGSWITPTALQARHDIDAIRQLAVDASHLGV